MCTQVVHPAHVYATRMTNAVKVCIGAIVAWLVALWLTAV